MHVTHFFSPIGLLEIKEENEHIAEVRFLAGEPELSCSNPVLDACVTQLDDYFKGTRKEFDLPLAPSGTAFQQKIWLELQGIPYGRIVSYMDISKRIGDVRSTRAVGLANGKNPIAIIIPCHRVIGSNGDLTGYAGGMRRKQWLLEHESSQTSLF